jgi:type I restriction enzyme S subunit
MFGNGFPFSEFAVNEHVFILRANEKVGQIFLYFLLKEDELAQLNSNSAQPGLNQQAMNAFEIVMPLPELIQDFESLAEPLVDKIFKNSNQIRTLQKLRDTLLPKLISGEVRVKQ